MFFPFGSFNGRPKFLQLRGNTVHAEVDSKIVVLYSGIGIEKCNCTFLTENCNSSTFL
jgi:hypothetical protein